MTGERDGPPGGGSTTDSGENSRRRKLVAGATAVATTALAGCGDYTESLNLEAVDVAGLAERAAVTDHERDEFVTALADHGRGVGTESRPPFGDGDVVQSPDGSYYEIADHGIGGHWIERAVGFEAIGDGGSGDGSDAADGNEEPLVASDLPATDRALLASAFPASETPSFGGDVDVSAVGRRVEDLGVDAQDGEESSVLADADGLVLDYDGDRFRIHVRTATRATVRSNFAITDSWPNATRYGEWLARQRSIELRDVSDDERDVLEDAVDGKCKRDGADAEAFDAVVARLESQPTVRIGEYESRRQWVVRWKGQLYWVTHRTDAFGGG